jgi:hypothetical protein
MNGGRLFWRRFFFLENKIPPKITPLFHFYFEIKSTFEKRKNHQKPLVMKTQGKLYRSVLIVLAVTMLLLLVPFIAMQFTNEVRWSGGDFLLMGLLISGTGMAYVLLTRTTANRTYRFAVAAALGTTFLLIWANLAVGLIGGGPHLDNLMYGVVPLVVMIGILRSRFRAAGMERSMYATALSLIVLMAIALLAGMQHYPGSSVGEILSVNGIFIALYLLAAGLFRAASATGSRGNAHS